MSSKRYPVSLLRGLRARPRLAGCTLAGVLLYAALHFTLDAPPSMTALIAWNGGTILYLALAWRALAGADPQGIRQAAAAQDQGAVAILVLVILAALAVLLAVGTQLAQVKGLHGPERDARIGLAALTVVTSWLFTQVLFALHYAHDFYNVRARGGPDPLSFPGTADPGYADFLHFACVIGTSGQTADVNFNGSALRPVGTVHCILAFFFNAALLALTVNLGANLFT